MLRSRHPRHRRRQGTVHQLAVHPRPIQGNNPPPGVARHRNPRPGIVALSKLQHGIFVGDSVDSADTLAVRLRATAPGSTVAGQTVPVVRRCPLCKQPQTATNGSKLPQTAVNDRKRSQTVGKRPQTVGKHVQKDMNTW
eukprot:gene14170-biopygen18616